MAGFPWRDFMRVITIVLGVMQIVIGIHLISDQCSGPLEITTPA